MTTQDLSVWDELFNKIPPEDLAPLLMKIYCELAEHKLENQDKINPDDATCLHSLRQVIQTILSMEKQNHDS